MLTVRRHTDAAAFLDRAEAWLLEAEAEHNLILSLARQLADAAASYDPPVYLATVEDDGAVVGCAFRTPPYKLGLTRMPLEALPRLAEAVAAVYPSLPAVIGPAEEAGRFAALWGEQASVAATPGMRQRIYQLTYVTPPDPWPPGHFRFAGPDDVPLVAQWIGAFSQETGIPLSRIQERAATLVDEKQLILWHHGRPVSMAAWTGQTPNGARVGYVYTPPEQRGHGYASACTAALSQYLLRTGRRFCFLYTDLANPTSNRIYQRLGYRPVCDVMDVNFA